jgi:hypothetical protein
LVYLGFSFCKRIEAVHPSSAQEFQQGNDFENDRPLQAVVYLVARASQAAEKRPCSVILSEAKNLSSF